MKGQLNRFSKCREDFWNAGYLRSSRMRQDDTGSELDMDPAESRHDRTRNDDSFLANGMSRFRISWRC